MRRLALAENGTLGTLESMAPSRSQAERWARRFLVLIPLCWAASLVISYQNALLILTLAAFGAAVLGIRSGASALGLIGMSMLCTLDAVTRHLLLTTGGLWRWNSYNYWLLAIMAYSLPRLMNLTDPHSRILRVLIGVLLVELAISPNFELGIQQLLGVGTTFGLLVYFLNAVDDDEAWYWQGVVSGLISSLGSLMYYVLKSQLPYVNENAWAFFPLSGIFAASLAFPAALRLGRSVSVLAVLGMTNLAWVFLSGSRGTLFISLACMLYIVIGTPGSSRRLAFLGVAVAVSLGASTYFADLEENSIHRLTKLFDSSESAAGRTSGRSDLGLGGYYIFLEHPLGVGTGGFAATWAQLGSRERLSGFKQGEEFQAHSGWIKILAENGVPGLLLLLSYVTSFAFVGRRVQDPKLRRLAYTVTGVLAVAFLSTEFQGKGFWFLSAGVTAMLHRVAHARSQNDARSGFSRSFLPRLVRG